MSGHTPGPWKWEDDNHVLWAQGGKKVIDAAPYEGMWLAGENEEADARLIAAAPDLLEALQDCLENTGGGWISAGVIDRARAAIAKATGTTD